MFHHSINKGLAIACLLSIFVLTFIASAHRQDIRVTEAFLKADEARMSGPCPLKVVFHGSITASGPGTVKYTFTRSDGARGPAYAMEFKEAGTQAVSTDWTLGDASALPHFEGWQVIAILSPNSYESNQAKFAIDCQPGKEKQPDAQPADNQQAKGTETTQQPGEKVSPVVLEGLRWGEKDSAARAEARKKAFEADRARFEPTATALADALKAAGVDLDGYLVASKQFVETPPGKTSQVDVDRVNQKFAGPIRAAIARAVGVPGVGNLLQSVQAFDLCCALVPADVPGVGDLLQSVQAGQNAPGALAPRKQNHRSGSGNSNGGPQAASCCSTNRFEPPFEGLFTEGGLGASAIRAGVTRQLDPMVRSAIVSAPHTRQASGRGFTVPATDRHVSVTVNLGTNWVIGLSGLGYSHVWLGLDMNVTNARGAVVCSAPHMEQDNRWTWVGGFLTLSDHRPGPSVTRTCEFNRNSGDPTDYAANVSASSDGTFIGFSGGYGYYYVDLGPVDVTTCP